MQGSFFFNPPFVHWISVGGGGLSFQFLLVATLWLANSTDQGWQTFSEMHPRVNISDFVLVYDPFLNYSSQFCSYILRKPPETDKWMDTACSNKTLFIKKWQQARYRLQAIICLPLLWANASTLLCNSQCLIRSYNSWGVYYKVSKGLIKSIMYTTTPHQELENGKKRLPSQRFTVRTRLNGWEYTHTKSMKIAKCHFPPPPPPQLPAPASTCKLHS